MSHDETRTLRDRATYHRSVHQEWERTRLRSLGCFGAFYAAGLWGAAMLALWLGGDLQPGEWRAIGAICLVAGILAAGGVNEWSMGVEWRKQLRIVDRVYDGDPEIVAPPPPADEYPVRLPCSLVLSPRVFMGGVLYLGPAGLLFAPHVTHAPELREPLRFEPLRSIVMERVFVRVPLLQAVLGRQPEVLCVRWEGGMALVGVPDPAETQRRIEVELGRWKFQ